MAKKKKPLLLLLKLLAKLQSKLAKLQSMPAKLLKKLLHPLLTLLLLLAKLQPLLAKLQPLLAKLLAPLLTLLLLLLLPSNSGSRNEKTGLRAGFFRLRLCGARGSQKPSMRLWPQPGGEGLGVGDAQIALRLVLAKIEAGCHRHPRLLQQGLRKTEAVAGMRAAIGIQIKRALRRAPE